MSVTYPAGFRAAGITVGIKPDGSADLALVAANTVVPAVGLFTVNRAAAPPVLLSRRHLSAGAARAILVNSGCANAGTGARGRADAAAMAAAAGAALGCEAASVVVCSTGPIGIHLPMKKVLAGIPSVVAALAQDTGADEDAARAIMTTDSVPKQASIAEDGFRIGGIAKGAGMLRPDVATMVVVLTTDAIAAPAELASVMAEVADVTFNSLNIDGAASTNDSVVLLASGESGRRPARHVLRQALHAVCADLAAQLARDAEGASRVVTIRVEGAADDGAARAVGRIIADSALVRASFFGGDPNWGRLLAAAGAGPFPFDPERVAVSYEGVEVARAGAPLAHDDRALAARLTGDFTVTMEIGDGPGTAAILTTDLTPSYVEFNGAGS